MKALKKQTVAKRKVFVAVNINDKATRTARMDAYLKDTHSVFLANLKLADDMQIVGNGALSGPVVKRNKKAVAL